jgi:hypothetical protein
MTGVAMTTKQGQRFLSTYEIDIYRQCFPIFTYFVEQHSDWTREEFVCMYKFIDQLGTGVEQTL